MNDVTRTIEAIERGDPRAAGALLPLVYQELKNLALRRLAQEAAGHTLQPTDLVHEVYLRLVDTDRGQAWDGRRHFFAAASEAMRRILVEHARRKQSLRHGNGRRRIELEDGMTLVEDRDGEVLAVDEALEQLALVDPLAVELVKLRYFSGLTMEQVAEVLHLPERSAYRLWAFARAWLYRRLHPDSSDPPP